MSRKLHLVDYIKIQPDQNLTKLSKSEKHRLMDSVLSQEDSLMPGSPKGLEVVFALSHSARKINNRIYPPWGQRQGVDSWLAPYPKPILLNHDIESDPIGRFSDMKWVSLESEAMEFFRNVNDFMAFKKAFDEDNPQEMYRMLRKHKLLHNDRWPGLSKLEATARITDPAAVEKFLDGRYLTFSAGSHTDKYRCGICGSSWHEDDICEHRPGRVTEDGDVGVFFTGTFYGREGSVVNGPADNLGYVQSLRQIDSAWLPKEISCEIDSVSSDSEQMIMTDSKIIKDDFVSTDDKVKEALFEMLAEATNHYMDKMKAKADSIDEKHEVEKEYDHTLSISMEEMQELHEMGETMVTTSSGDETMVIRVVFEGYEEMGEDADSLIEMLEDEKKFKVPSGARGNARKVLDWKKKYGNDVKGMTAVGWARARQLASQSEIPLSTVKRMAAFNRHRKNAAVAPEYKDEPWKDRGYVAWLGWGGTSGIDWAIKISEANDSDESAEEIHDSQPIEKITVLDLLESKLALHNKECSDNEEMLVTLGTLKTVYRRGVDSYSSENTKLISKSAWGLARVNAFLHLVRTGAPKSLAYQQDNDLLPAGHPKNLNK